MKVIATATGFDGKKVRVAGEEFEMPKGTKGSWFESVEDKPEGKPKGTKGEPNTDPLV